MCVFSKMYFDRSDPSDGHGSCQVKTVRSRILVYGRILGKRIVQLLEKRLKGASSPLSLAHLFMSERFSLTRVLSSHSGSVHSSVRLPISLHSPPFIPSILSISSVLICTQSRAENTLSVLGILPRSFRWGCLKMNLVYVSLSARGSWNQKS
jgi:hypothetical protein